MKLLRTIGNSLLVFGLWLFEGVEDTHDYESWYTWRRVAACFVVFVVAGWCAYWALPQLALHWEFLR